MFRIVGSEIAALEASMVILMNLRLNLATWACLAAVITAFPASAKDFDDLKIGDIACYDRFGPFNVIGRIVNKNPDTSEILLENTKGKRTWYPSRKFRNVASCKLTAAATKWLVNQGVDRLSQ